ncbi:MAG: hypothetical protein JST32_19845, partial [Bacteroidetes bacterium]|nr:hypothetical protein [Bacteroidota bacterium]
MKITIAIMLLFMGGSLHAQAWKLQCEHLENPLDIDAVHPRLLWRAPVSQRSFRLTVWDEQGRVCWQITGKEEQELRYAGLPLRPFIGYHWKVVLNGKTASPLASFETGPMSISDWQGD